MKYAYDKDEVTTADVLDWLGNENSFTIMVEMLTSLLNRTETIENLRAFVLGFHEVVGEDKNQELDQSWRYMSNEMNDYLNEVSGSDDFDEYGEYLP